MSTAFRYILRYYIEPGYAEDERIAELIEACRVGRIEEVMLFYNAEETNVGHFTDAELDRWLVLAKKVKAALAGHNIALSINPWTTLVHSARGRKLREGQNFTLMVGENGKDNGVTACPLCPQWQDYLAAQWAKVARELKPVAIWAEDDWRLHNHSTTIGFGGCYCRLHLEEFSRRVGRKVTREELLEKVFAPGEPHPWRKVWLDLNGDSMAAVLKKIHDAIHAASPETSLAQMCGGFDVAGAEGRNWHRFQEASGFEPVYYVRPNLGCYTEKWAMLISPVGTRLVLSALKRPIGLYPEFESGPRHGAYSKGENFSRFQILSAAAVGAHGITMNHYDMMGCGIAVAPKFPAMLGKLKPRLNALKALGIDDDNALGANLLVRSDMARYYHAEKNAGVPGILNASAHWGTTASILGFSIRLTGKIPADKRQVLLLNNQTPRAYTDAELAEMLTHPVILDADAAQIFIERGFARQLGVAEKSVLHRYNVSDYSYEEIPESDPGIYGVANPRMTAQRAVFRMRAFTPLAGTETLSVIKNGAGKVMFPGALRCGNAVLLAYPVGNAGRGDPEWFYMGFFNCFRRIFIHRILQSIAPEMKGLFAENDPLWVNRVALPYGGELLAFINHTNDPAEKVVATVPGMDAKRKFLLLDQEGKWLENKIQITPYAHGVRLVVPQELPPLEGCFILAK